MPANVIAIPADGLKVGNATTDKLGFFGAPPMPQRGDASQAAVQADGMASCIHFTSNSGTIGGPGANTCAKLVIPAPGVVATDFVAAVCKPTANAGWALAQTYVANADGVDCTSFCANANVNPGDNEQIATVAFRNAMVVSANLAPGEILAGQMKEVQFTLDGTGAAATATIDSEGALTGITVANAGVGYYVPPKVVITPAAPLGANWNDTGTMAGLPGNEGGYGASARAVVANGTVTGVIIDNPGFGYTSAPTISFVGGSGLRPGQLLCVNKPTIQANVSIGNCRVVSSGKIGITYFVTGAANVTPTANEAYTMLGLDAIPAISPYMELRANVANFAQTTANRTGTLVATVQGVVATDWCVGVGPATAVANIVFNPDPPLASNVTAKYLGGGNTQVTPANGLYNFTIHRANMEPVMDLFQVKLDPGSNSVAAANCVEIVYALPANVTLQANSAVIVNRLGTPQANLTIVGARANSTSSIGITYYNNSSAAITPTAAHYLIGNFKSLITTLHANLVDGYCMKPVSKTVNRAVDLANAIRSVLAAMGIIKGS